MTVSTDILIVGAGQGGAQVAISLRQGGFEGSITMVGDEPDAPYDRPPLSKDYLAGEKTVDRLSLRKPEFWQEKAVDLCLGARVVTIDADSHQATTDQGRTYHYGKLIWAAGGFARPLSIPGGDHAGIHVIRTRAQVDQLRSEAETAQNIVIIGGGYIGLEAAAVLIKQGKKITLLEAEDRVLARVAGADISAFYEAEHRRQGVDIGTGVGVTHLTGENGRVKSVVLANGDELTADLVIAGIGLVPNKDVMEAAGAKCSNGVDVDDLCRTSLADIFSIGDCACHKNSYADGVHLRVESVPNAVGQAKAVASVILGAPKPFTDVPWFWSNQYDLKLQTAGLNHGYDETLLRGDPASRSFSLLYLRKGQIIAVDAVNMIKDFMAGKKLVAQAIVVDKAQLADTEIPLKSFVV
ncbi:MAG: FAD-dependent oxidoreductase [Emcibacter sp.]|nr:FAD-dependent oxidoreductase [Emcibacter sp.]